MSSAGWMAVQAALASAVGSVGSGDLAALARARQAMLQARDEVMRSMIEAARVPQGSGGSARSRGDLLARLLKRKMRRRRDERRRKLGRWVASVSGWPLEVADEPRVQERLSARRLERARRYVGSRGPHPASASIPDLLDQGPVSGSLGEAWGLRVARLRRAANRGPIAGGDNQSAGQGGPLSPASSRFGLNETHLFDESYGGAFGEASDILDDVAVLGAGVIRQVGLRDLLLGMVLIPPVVDATETCDCPTEGPNPCLPLVRDFGPSLRFFRDAMREQLEALAARDLRAVLTLISYGGGSTDKGMSKDSKVESAIIVHWPSVHHDADIDGVAFDYETYGCDILDIRSEYQIRYLERYVDAICSMLKKLEAELFFGLGLDCVLYGLELVNEIDIRNIMPTRTAGVLHYGLEAANQSAKRWAYVLYRLAKVVYQHFHGRLPALLPGVSSPNADEDVTSEFSNAYPRTWTYKSNFLDALLGWFTWYFAKDTSTWDRPAEGVAGLLGSVDVHFYHNDIYHSTPEGVNLGPQHVGRLSWQLSSIRSMLTAHGLSVTGTTVFESGTTARASPSSYLPSTIPASDIEVWQAWEVWRRVCGAFAAQADICGWHTWRGRPDRESAFFGFGLRRDLSGEAPEAALQRSSWFAYQRLTGVLAGALTAAFVLPSSLNVTRSSLPVDDLVIMQFTGEIRDPDSYRVYAYAYLVMVDGWRDTARTFNVRMRSSSGKEVLVMMVGVAPTSYTTTAGSAGSYSYNTATFAPSTAVSLGVAGLLAPVRLADGPTLYLGDSALSWELAGDPGAL